MLRKILAGATIVALFACSQTDDPDPTPSPNPSSPSTGGSSSSQDVSGNSSSSLEETTPSSSSAPLIFVPLHNFEEESDYTVGYVFGSASLQNEVVLDDDGNEVLDDEGNPYRIWNPNGIFTLKDFTLNGGSTSESGGGLIIKNLPIKDYAAFKFKVCGTASGNHQFRIKAEKDVEGETKGVAFHKTFPVSSECASVTIEIDDSFQRTYNDTDIPNKDVFEYVLENATEVEFVIPSLSAATEAHTLEIDDFEGALKSP